ncbi:acetyl-CoA carboxylase, carboxyltransferase subunit beta [Candidatus Margulisiibacteriota bacterium]
MHDWFIKKKQEKELEYKAEKLDIPGHLWIKCFKCKETIYNKDLDANLKVCPKCGYHFKLTHKERLDITADPGTFKEMDNLMISKDFLNFVDTQAYSERLKKAKAKTGMNDAIITGEAKIGDVPVSLGIMDFSFMGGSMGSVVGEKVTRLIENSIKKKIPAIILNASGGARMQEGIMSLMQMAKTSAALAKLRDKRIPYISVCTDPTTAGVSASYAMLGDLIIAETGALIGFAGPRVIEQTIRQKLPPGFQRAEFLKEHGLIDKVVERRCLKETLIKILRFFVEEEKEDVKS